MSSLRLLADRPGIVRLDGDERVPEWALEAPGLLSITRREGELSIVCAADSVPPGVRAEVGFRALEVSGPMDLGIVGVVAALAEPLARAQIALSSPRSTRTC